jgi:hypothetical protein
MNSEDSDENFADLDEEATERMEAKYGFRLFDLDVLKLAGVKE